MSAPAQAAHASRRGAVHVYGVVASESLAGLELPEEVEAVTSGPVAALVSAAADGQRGLAGALRRHDAVVGAVVAQAVTIVPMRFGTTVTEPDALAADVLDAHRAPLLAALSDLDGVVQYTVRVDYVRDAVTRAAIRDDPGIASLRAQAGRDQAAQIRLGQRIVAAIDRRRGGDAQRMLAGLDSVAREIKPDLSGDPDRIGDFACLVERGEQARFETAVEDLAARHHEAVRMTLVGPLAPYDFVPEL